MKRNNPLNIRYNSSNNWLGQLGNENGFVKFQSPYYGMRAAVKLICNYLENGCCTFEDIIYRWAPPSENPTAKYVSFVESYFQSFRIDFTRNEIFPELLTSSSSKILLSAFLQAMNLFENGSDNCQLDFDDWYFFLQKPKINSILAGFERKSASNLFNE